MGVGIILGVFWGLVVSLVLAAAVSLSTPLPERRASEGSQAEAPASPTAEEATGTEEAAGAEASAAAEPAGTPDEAAGEGTTSGDGGTGPDSGAPAESIPLPAGSEFNRPPPEEEAVVPGVDTAPGTAAPDAPPVPLQTFSDGIDTAPAPQPDVFAPPAAPQPVEPDGGDVSVPGTEDGAAAAPIGSQPGQVSAPEPDSAASPDAAPAPRPGIDSIRAAAENPAGPAEPAADAIAPVAGAADDATADATPASSASTPERNPGPAEDIAPDVFADLAQAPAGDDAPSAPEAADTSPASPPASVVDLVPSQETAPEAAPAEEDAMPAGSPDAAPDLVRPRILRPATDAGPTRTLPQIVTPGRDEGLPMAGDAPESEAEAADAAAEADMPEGEVPALVAHAVPFDESETRPLIAVVLIDEPDARLDLSTLTGFSFPVAFAVDPMRPDAAERAAAFREAGFEVVMLGSAIPEGATATDTEVALAAAHARVPQAVAVIDTPEGRIQSDRAVLEATVGAVAGEGQGLLAFPRGMNTAEQMAARADVPAATLFRLLDDADQSAPVITRYLGRAEFAAVQEGAAVVAGRTRPDTVTALYSWALGNRNEGVAIAPVSAVLRRMAEDE
jgi:hypothetical protein